MRGGPLGQDIGMKVVLSLARTTSSAGFQVSLILAHRGFEPAALEVGLCWRLPAAQA